MARAALALVAVAILAAPATAAANATPRAAIAALNAQREKNGFPAGIREDTLRSKGCANHNLYQRRNGNQLVHGEKKGRPGYTKSGDEASKNAVLAQGASWSEGNPWETAPVHLMQLLSPRLKTTGVADKAGFVCMTTFLGMDYANGPASHVVYTYPGDGAKRWRASEVAEESPYTPGDKLGLKQPRRTGPYIYALLDRPGDWFELRDQARLTSATLTGPKGAVALKTMDSARGSLRDFMMPGAYIIPVKPLAKGTYTGSVTFTVDAVAVSKTWSFSVG